MNPTIRPLPAAEMQARADLRNAHARLTEITKGLRIPLDTYLEIHALARKIENASATARAEMIYAMREETLAIAYGLGCDNCGGHKEITGHDANGSPWSEPCVRCA